MKQEHAAESDPVSLTAHRRRHRVARAATPEAASDTPTVTVVVAVAAHDIDTERLREAVQSVVAGPADDGSATDPESISVGDVHMDLGSLQVSVGEQPVVLTYQEFRLLRAFLEHPGHVLTRRQLLAQAWDDTTWGEGRTVDVHVRRLRVKLARSRAIIATVRRFGYRFDLP